ncbi:2'-5' RNA ligase family protein [Mucilaginibacter arboris]|uniref:2'-5' RNA ligase family protein n=1 Tax=Mucilaginibacter arboris TaxID=2682090 RepID=A0A7K1T0X8_9SPHI|nr:2'-5' RNA ligase family protein [Mucilaginibacter arboris]MVN23199.1 2'-5' RNA ligase family protein [Mucilaginibacter arboris]
MLSENPVILTLKINDDAAAYFTELRKKHFPAERNYLDAHLTLFHHLPPNEPAILEVVKTVSLRQNPMVLQVMQVVSIGAGVAFKLQSEALLIMHKNLQQQWQEWLTPQDQQTLWPHITVQNKVDRQKAVGLQQELSKDFKPFEIQGLGLTIWEYLGGPWQKIETLNFDDQVLNQ